MKRVARTQARGTITTTTTKTDPKTGKTIETTVIEPLRTPAHVAATGRRR